MVAAADVPPNHQQQEEPRAQSSGGGVNPKNPDPQQQEQQGLTVQQQQQQPEEPEPVLAAPLEVADPFLVGEHLDSWAEQAIYGGSTQVQMQAHTHGFRRISTLVRMFT